MNFESESIGEQLKRILQQARFSTIDEAIEVVKKVARKRGKKTPRECAYALDDEIIEALEALKKKG